MYYFKFNLNDLKKLFLIKMFLLQSINIIVVDFVEIINCIILSFNLIFEILLYFGLCRRWGFGINLFYWEN